MTSLGSALPLQALMPVLLGPALAWAVLEDLLYRRIRNRLVVLLAVLWLAGLGLCLIGGGGRWPDLLAGAAWSLPGVLIVLAVGFPLFQIGQIGAGDIKLMAVLCLWVGAQQQPAFLIATSLAGGLLVLLMPLLAPLELVAARCWWGLMCRVPRLAGTEPPHSLSGKTVPGVPYALAIAAGMGFVLAFPATP